MSILSFSNDQRAATDWEPSFASTTAHDYPVDQFGYLLDPSGRRIPRGPLNELRPGEPEPDAQTQTRERESAFDRDRSHLPMCPCGRHHVSRAHFTRCHVCSEDRKREFAKSRYTRSNAKKRAAGFDQRRTES